MFFKSYLKLFHVHHYQIDLVLILALILRKDKIEVAVHLSKCCCHINVNIDHILSSLEQMFDDKSPLLIVSAAVADWTICVFSYSLGKETVDQVNLLFHRADGGNRERIDFHSAWPSKSKEIRWNSSLTSLLYISKKRLLVWWSFGVNQYLITCCERE